MGVFQNNLLAGAAAAASAGGGGFYDYQIQQSCRFDGSSSYLYQTFSGAGNRRTGSFSVWVKRSLLSTQQMIFNPYVSNGDQDELLQFNSSSSADHADSISQWWDGANSGDDNTFVGYGKVKAAVFNHRGKAIFAYRFVPDKKRGIVEYYDNDGNMLRRQFLKSPIKFQYRISSR